MSNHNLISLSIPRKRRLKDPTLVKTESDLNPTRFNNAKPIATILQTHGILHTPSNIPKANSFSKASNQRLLGLLNKGFAKFVFIVLININVPLPQRAGELKQFLLMGGFAIAILQGFRDFDIVKSDLVRSCCNYLFLS